MKSNYSTRDIFRLMQAETKNTTPTHVMNERMFLIETSEDELLADAILIRKGGQAFSAAAGVTHV